MTEVEAKPKRGRGCILLPIALVLLAFLLFAPFAPDVVLLAYTVVSGPVTYPSFVVPRIHPNAAAIATGIIAFVGTSVGFHLTARWLHRAIAGAGATWKPRWTAAAIAVFVLTFAVAMDVAGVVHQSGWLATAPPKSVLYDEYRDVPFQLRGLCNSLGDERALRESQVQSVGLGNHDAWEFEIVRRPDGSAGGAVARARDPRSAFAGRAFTCDGLVSEAAAAGYIARIESPAPTP